MKISDINLRIILDSRGEETLEAELKSGSFLAISSAPAGKSTGAHEAYVLEPKKAIEKFEIIKPQILAASASGRIETQDDFDNFLIALDGTENKSNFGGNLILSLSLAFARLKAKEEKKELHEYITQCLGSPMSPKLNKSILGHRTSLISPRPIFNVINGGAHATHPKNNLDFQEFQIIPEIDDFSISLSLGKIFYRKLGNYLKDKFRSENVFLGDEAGYSAPFKNNEEAIECLAEIIEKYNYPLRIGLDVAASQFYLPSEALLRPSIAFGEGGAKECEYGYYEIDGKKYSAEELKDYYFKLIETYNILSIEDPFNEESFDDFKDLTTALHYVSDSRSNVINEKLIITDDLTTTNPERLKMAIDKKSGNVILIKPNQIGTLTETLKVIKLAYKNNWRVIVSHRSGETLDDFIADLAVGIGAWGIKAGAPAKPERLAKYERIIKILEI